MGIVYLARDVALDRPVAIKLLPPALALQPELAERFLREARTAARLSHPNIVTVHAVEQHRDLAFFVMAYVDGETLGQRVRRAGPLTPHAVTRICQEVAWALAYAHSNGVIHRDVKPDNILLERVGGRAMVTDFGIARVVETTGQTAPGEMVGTAHYMSPEQALGEPADGRSDVYALGVTAFLALAGRLPFDAPAPVAVLGMHVNAAIPSIAELRPGIPAALADAVQRCLAKLPADRFQSGEKLAEAVAAQADTGDAPLLARLFLQRVRSVGDTIAVVIVAVFFYLLDLPWLGFALLALLPVYGAVRTGRGLLKSGMGVDDVRLALAREERDRLELMGPALAHFNAALEKSRSAAKPPSRTTPLRRGVVWCLAGGLLLTLALMEGVPASFTDVLGIVGGLLIAGVGVTELWQWRSGVADRALPTLLTPRQRISRMAQSTLRSARTFLKLAGIGLKPGPAKRTPSTEPTEFALAAAVEDIFDELPADQRRTLARLPDVVRRLRADAHQLRLRAGGDAADTRIKDRLATVVAALESVRLDLLRLRVGGATVQTVTADLEAAEQIGRRVNAELEGRASVEDLLDASRRPTRSGAAGFTTDGPVGGS